jgi:hypothetical protein
MKIVKIKNDKNDLLIEVSGLSFHKIEVNESFSRKKALQHALENKWIMLEQVDILSGPSVNNKLGDFSTVYKITKKQTTLENKNNVSTVKRTTKKTRVKHEQEEK